MYKRQPLYLIGALVLGAGFLYWAIATLLNRNAKAPIQTFWYSIIYLFALFIIMLADHYIYPEYGHHSWYQPPVETTPGIELVKD